MSLTPDPDHSPFTLTLFGGFAVSLTGGLPLPPLRSRRGLYLLALLALQVGNPWDRDRIAGTLWPESGEAQALENLRKTLKDLRKALGDDATRILAPTARTLDIDLTQAQCDVVEFDRLTRRQDITSLTEATRLYQGPLLAGWTEDWMLAERKEREEAYLRALETLTEAANANGNSEEAAQFLRRIVFLDPLRESAQRNLLTTLAASGNYGAATQAYRDLRLHLKQELNTEPDPETQALYQQIRSDAREKSRVGEARTEKPGDAPKSPTLSSLPPLPRPRTSFVGRTSEVSRIITRLQDASLVSLVGPGGVGKTRIALSVAHSLTEESAPEIAFADLSALDDAELLASVVAVALGIEERKERAIRDVVISFLRDRRFLLILDNSEHLIDAAARFADNLLNACPNLRILTTSRQALGIPGEAVIPIAPLLTPDPKRFLRLAGRDKGQAERLLQYDAVHLFVDRALTANPDFRLQGETTAAVAHICSRLDGLPLALELAAPRLKVLSASQIAAKLDVRLDERFRLLGGNVAPRTVPRRQQALLAALDWSYDLLSEQERVLLRRLSLFSGGCTLDAVESICADLPEQTSNDVIENWEILDLLTGLADKSLIVVESRGDEPPRYRFLESIREYGLKKLREESSPDEEDTIRQRHATYFAALIQEINPKLFGSNQVHWLDSLEMEHDNFRSALNWSIEHEGRAAVLIVRHLWRFWEVRGYRDEGISRLLHVQTLPAAEEMPDERSWLLMLAGAMAHKRGDNIEAEEYVRAALAIQEKHQLRKGMAASLNYLGNFALFRGNGTVAWEYYEKSLAIKREFGDRRAVAITIYNMAAAAAWAGDYEKARPLANQAMKEYRAIGDDRMIGDGYINLGNLSKELGEYADAKRYLNEGLSIHRRIGNQQGCAVIMVSLGQLAIREKHWSEAHRILTEALALSVDLHVQAEILDCLLGFAQIALIENQPIRAVRLLGARHAALESIGLATPRGDQERSAQAQNDVQSMIGAYAFEEEWQKGLCLSLDQAITYAQENTG